ncbi:MAG: endonuclease/exonuclease/phosphatase family protein, partial [Candidatus Promineifilaceae bacterium]
GDTIRGDRSHRLRFLARHAIEPGLRHLSVAGGFGMLMMVSLLFAYYAAYDIALPIPNSFLPAIALLIVAALTFQAQRFAWSTRVRLGSPARALTSLLLLAMVCPVLLASGRGMPAPPASTNGQVRVMSYNLHNGFNPLGQLDLESLAQTIEAAHVDVVGLQEVSRGWAINGSVDMFTWLAHRLQMNAVFGPTAGSQWGNAVLTRLPITSWENQPLPGEGLLLQRGYLRVELSASDGKPLTILNTHYHNPENGSLVRQEQSEAILAVASELTKFMITGDLNAQPGSEEIEMLRRTELRDVLDIAGETPGYTNPVPEPWRRIDYVWVSEDWIIIDAGVPYTAASDHLPVTAILE